MIRVMHDGRTKRTGRDYALFRVQIFWRATGRCEMSRNGERCNRYAPLTGLNHGAVHHINGRGMGGGKRDDNPEVCKWACWECHDRKHNRLHWSRLNATKKETAETKSR